eukprot:TRINITY_DN287_c0_g1_i1.p1 TRINITY_DN287_c0_g1~~TRINITY_DN287_c0_g1_i1.p1  ORF type:complete len:252 (+),score=19.16 TRINITY_DN287_c0_g1_i1:523-1278(+)
MEEKKHFVLVHGAGHGAWCWYKLATQLNSAGHRVTALDLAASGINTKQLSELKNVFDYHKPLMEMMESLPSDEKVVLVGHSFGGVGLSLAMETFPQKIEVAVFVTASMLSYNTPWSTMMEKFPMSFDSMDSKITSGSENQLPTFLFGQECLSSKLYQRCKPEDLTLAKTLVRPANIYEIDIMLSEEKYGSVNRVYIVCNEDKIMAEDFQRWLIDYTPVNDVMEIDGSDHMAMLSKPHELYLCLLEIANKYA